MLILIYTVLSFLFFKIMPEFMFDASNSVLGALMMAIASAICMFATTYFINMKALTQLKRITEGRATDAFIVEAAAPALIGIAAAMGSGYLVGVGFSKEFLRKVFAYYSDDWPWFFVMLAIPPIVHVAIVLRDIQRIERAITEDHNDDRSR